MSKNFYVTVEALRMALNKDYKMNLPVDVKFILTTESDKEKEQNYVADLEAKLAESEKNYDLKYKHWIEEIRESDRLRVLLADKDKTIDEINKEFLSAIKDWKQLVEIEKTEKEQLKQQLAESQKKKEDFKTIYFKKCLDYEHLHEKFDDKCAEFELKEYDYKQTIFEKSQDKIDFAIEQLEKVRKEFDCEDNYCYGDNNIIICVNKKIFNKTIDNQMKDLKKELE